MRITISGLPGSGTSTVAKIIASKLDYPLISAGEIFRELARKRGYTLEQFGKIAEQDSEIDLYIDKLQKERAEKKENAVVEGRLSGWMVKEAFKVFLFADRESRVSRIAKRENKEIYLAREETINREKDEERRYSKFYGIDVRDWSNYHLILNSGYFDPENIAEIVFRATEVKISEQ
ncbi:MAG: AAA family ATPase [Archaeoglobaceae archaeon]